MGPRIRILFRAFGLAASVLACLILAFAANAQAPAAPPPAQQEPAPKSPSADSTAEVTTREGAPTFKVRVNLVLVRVVVRNAQGRAIGTLHKEDFRLFDKGKLQVVSTFAVERPGSHTEASRATEAAPKPTATDAGAPVLPERFAALLFDDLDLSTEDAMQARVAAAHFLDALQPSDRVALFTMSGQDQVDFTSDHAQLSQALEVLIPRPLIGNLGLKCPDISFYEADQIVNRNDPQALDIATEDTLACLYDNDRRMTQVAQAYAQSTAQQVVVLGEASTLAAFRRLDEVVRRMAVLPGQRTIVLVSPGFLTTFATRQSTEVIDRATRENVVISAIDARGLYATPPGGDISSPSAYSPRTAGLHSLYQVSGQTAQADVLAELAYGSGGIFFHNRNDLGEGMRLLAAAPEFSYVLGFSPQNLKFDGSYHELRVSLASKEKYNLQARRGYFAPKGSSDPAESARKEIEEEIFSQEELRDLPVELQTQYFRKDPEKANLAVLTRVDLKGLKFRKAEGRNQNNLTVATAIFDENGNFVIGGEKVVEMKLRDTTLERLGHSGITLKSNFDVKPGIYMVRLVVRDSEGEQMGTRSSPVKIPF